MDLLSLEHKSTKPLPLVFLINCLGKVLQHAKMPDSYMFQSGKLKVFHAC